MLTGEKKYLCDQCDYATNVKGNLTTHQNQGRILFGLVQTLGIVVVVYHVTIVAIGHWLLKKFWPLVLGCVLRIAESY